MTTEDTTPDVPETEDSESIAENVDIQLEAILADPSEPFKLESGLEVQIERVKLIQLMRFLKILTSSASDALTELRFDPENDQDEFVSSLLMALVISIPDAERQVVEFVSSLVRPAGLVEGRKLPKSVQKQNEELWDELTEELFNPDLDDLFNILSRVYEVEKDHLLDLGKKLKLILQTRRPQN